jgi:hypothetical protein
MEPAVAMAEQTREAGIFASAQARYAEHGIATFPLRENKRPAIRGYNRVGLCGSWELARKFPHATALGFLTDKRSGITGLDVDTTDELVFADALIRHGDTPIKVRTASGKYHAWYKHNGERRRIRPFGELPIDLLGTGGLIVAPPSWGPKGSYAFIEGGLEDLNRLPVMFGLSTDMYDPVATTADIAVPEDFLAAVALGYGPDVGPIPRGRRNDTLWRFCMRTARTCASVDDLIAVARVRNAECSPPQSDMEVLKIAASAWGYEQRGQNRFGRTGAFLPTSEVNGLIAEPNVLLLLMFLKANNGPTSKFMVANGLAERLHLSRKSLAVARKRLIELDYIVQIRAASGGHKNVAALYSWKTRKNFGGQL